MNEDSWTEMLEHGENLSYLALGDSYTIGESVAEKDRWPVILSETLRDKGMNIRNPKIIAKTGWTSDELKKAILDSELNTPYDIVSLSIGVNNQYRGRDVEEYRIEFAELIEMAIAYAGNDPTKVIVLSIPDWGLTPFARKRDGKKIAREIAGYNRVKKEETLKRNVIFVNISEISEKVKTDSSYNANDGLHYSGKMHRLWVDEIIRTVFN